MNLSYSKLTTLQDCPRRFYYQYILRLEEEPVAIPYGELGSRGHLVLEDFYKYVNIEAEDIEGEFNSVLGRLYHKHFRGLTDPKGNFAKGARNFCNKEIIRYKSLKDKSLFIPRYNEIALEATIAGEFFRGRLDAVYNQPNGDLKLVDFKFTGSNSIGLPQKIQAVIYVSMIEQKLGVSCDEFFFWFMRHGGGPTGIGYEKVIDITDDLRETVENLIVDAAETIEKGEYSVKSNFADFFCMNFCSFYGACMADNLEFEI